MERKFICRYVSGWLATAIQYIICMHFENFIARIFGFLTKKLYRRHPIDMHWYVYCVCYFNLWWLLCLFIVIRSQQIHLVANKLDIALRTQFQFVCTVEFESILVSAFGIFDRWSTRNWRQNIFIAASVNWFCYMRLISYMIITNCGLVPKLSALRTNRFRKMYRVWYEVIIVIIITIL